MTPSLTKNVWSAFTDSRPKKPSTAAQSIAARRRQLEALDQRLVELTTKGDREYLSEPLTGKAGEVRVGALEKPLGGEREALRGALDDSSVTRPEEHRHE